MGVVRALRDSAPGTETEGSPPIPSNGALVQAALDGHAWAHEALFRRHVRMVSGLSYRILAGSGLDVDDLVQDVFVTAFARLGSLRDPSAFSSWLGSIVVRTASKNLRRQRFRLRWGLVRAEEVDLDLSVSSGASPEVALLLKEIYAVVEQLRPDERIVFLLRRVEGLTVAEIADQMGTSLSTVKRRLSAAEGRFDRSLQRRSLTKGLWRPEIASNGDRKFDENFHEQERASHD